MQLCRLLMMLTLFSVVMARRHLGISLCICYLKSQLIGSIRISHRVLFLIGILNLCGKSVTLRCHFVLFSRIAMKLVHANLTSKNWANSSLRLIAKSGINSTDQSRSNDQIPSLIEL